MTCERCAELERRLDTADGTIEAWKIQCDGSATLASKLMMERDQLALRLDHEEKINISAHQLYTEALQRAIAAESRLDSISAALADPHNNPLAAIRRILAGGVERQTP